MSIPTGMSNWSLLEKLDPRGKEGNPRKSIAVHKWTHTGLTNTALGDDAGSSILQSAVKLCRTGSCTKSEEAADKKPNVKIN